MNAIDMTPEQVRALDTDTLVEAIAQMLYEHAQYMQDAEDEAVDEDQQERYNIKMDTYCAAAEYVRAMIRD